MASAGNASQAASRAQTRRSVSRGLVGRGDVAWISRSASFPGSPMRISGLTARYSLRTANASGAALRARDDSAMCRRSPSSLTTLVKAATTTGSSDRSAKLPTACPFHRSSFQHEQKRAPPLRPQVQQACRASHLNLKASDCEQQPKPCRYRSPLNDGDTHHEQNQCSPGTSSAHPWGLVPTIAHCPGPRRNTRIASASVAPGVAK